MTLQHVDIVFQLIAFLFAISVHESAHAWMANQRGDPTARMLGRITLNPIKHIDPFGTVLLPLMAMFWHFPVIGWAKPTPVDPRNFKNHVLDDILTSVAGPVSNFTVAAFAVVLLALVKLVSPTGRQIIFGIPQGWISPEINLIPVPPLDGSHVLRHFLPAAALRIYDTAGYFGLLLLVFFASDYLWKLIGPVVGLFKFLLSRV